MPRITYLHRLLAPKPKKRQSRPTTDDYVKPYFPSVQSPARYMWFGYDGPEPDIKIGQIQIQWAATHYQLFGQAVIGDDTWYQIVMDNRGQRRVHHPYYVDYGGERFYFVNKAEAHRFVDHNHPANPTVSRAH